MKQYFKSTNNMKKASRNCYVLGNVDKVAESKGYFIGHFMDKYGLGWSDRRSRSGLEEINQ